MSAIDPSFRGLPLTGGSGGTPPGPTIPVADPADLLVGATASSLIGTDASGVGAVVSYDSLRANGRRPSLTDMELLYELQESSGTFANTGTLGATGDLATVGATVEYRALTNSTIGRGVRFPGDATSLVHGATGLKPPSTTNLTQWVVATVEANPPGRKNLFMRALTTSMGVLPYISTAIVVSSSGNWLVEIGRLAGGYTEMSMTPPIGYSIGRQHLFGLSYDGTTLKAILDGVTVSTRSAPGNINWGDAYGDGDWWLANNPINERSTCTITRAGAGAVVWTPNQWGEAYQRLIGAWQG